MTTSGLIQLHITANAPPPPPPVSGSVATISLNNRQSLDPNLNPAQNANYPLNAPWLFTVNTSGWVHMTDYCGAVFCANYGAQGSYMMYGAAGHSAGGPCIWVRFDVASRMWSLVGKALPTDSLQNFFVGNTPVLSGNPPATRFDPVWGDYDGGSLDWPAAWRQPGFNPPEGSHTRGSFAYRPAAAAGNLNGQILVSWQPTGAQGGTGLKGSFYFDLDTGLWHRTANLRPSSSSFEMTYDAVNDQGLCVVAEGSHFADAIYVLDCKTMTWRTVGVVPYPVAPHTFYAWYDSVQFICGGLFIVVNYPYAATTTQATAAEFWAMPISQIMAGTGMQWTRLNVNAPSLPMVTCLDFQPPRVLMSRVVWAGHSDGNFYAHARAEAPHTLWKLTPPAGNDAAKLAGTWNITTQTLAGEALVAANFDYSRTQYCPALDGFLWTGDSTTGPVQVIKPI